MKKLKKQKPRRLYQHQHGDMVFVVVSKETKHVIIWKNDGKDGRFERFHFL